MHSLGHFDEEFSSRRLSDHKAGFLYLLSWLKFTKTPPLSPARPHRTSIFIPLLYLVFLKLQCHLQNFSMQSAYEGVPKA